MQFLSTESYLETVLSKAQSTDANLITIFKSKFSNQESEAKIIEAHESFALDATNGAEGIVRIVKLNDFANLEKSGYLVKNWVYDRLSSSVIINLRRGSHSAFCGSLYGIYTNTAKDDLYRFDKNCNLFLDRGFGFYKSSVSLKFAVVSDEVKLNYQERIVFKEYLPH